jgi:DNA-binding NarL/FixJ family response regulator
VTGHAACRIRVAIVGRDSGMRDKLAARFSAVRDQVVAVEADDLDEAAGHDVDVVLVALSDGSGIAVIAPGRLASWLAAVPEPLPSVLVDWDVDDDVLATVTRLVASRLLPTPSDAAPVTSAIDTLTPREMQVLGLLAGGWSPDEIATDLGISLHTVRTHLARVGTKLGIRSRVEAITRARRDGLLSLREPTPCAGDGPKLLVVSPSLTAREREVLSLLALGLTDPEVAERCYLSRHTVRTHVRNVMRKLDVHSRVDAVLLALDQRLVEAPVRPPS